MSFLCIASGRIRGLSKSQFEETKNTLSNALKELTKDDSVIEQIDQIQKSNEFSQQSFSYICQITY
jgi:Zn-dependent M16 (insulinase) family peptidase